MRLPGTPAIPGFAFYPFFLAAAYVLLWALLLPYYQFRLYADTFSYLDLARHYGQGDWYQALNGYWAPLVSWLLAPGLAAGGDALLSFRILTMASGLLALWGANRLMQVYRVLPLVRAFLLAALVPLLAWLALQVNTPDLLAAALLLFYLAEAARLLDIVAPAEAHALPSLAAASCPAPLLPSRLSGSQGKRALREGLLVGALGAGAYLAKNYNFFFVGAHLAGLLLYAGTLKQGRHRRGPLLRSLALAALVFLLLCACWILPISWKYGGFTIGTAGRFNVSLAAPDSKGFPYLYQGLLPPPHASARHSWEDPGLYQLPGWKPWSSAADLAFEFSLFGHNVTKYLAMVWHYHPLVLVIVLLAAWLMVQAEKKEKRHLGLSLFAFLLYPLGYCLIYLEERHIWICLLLSFVLTAQVLSALLRQARPWQQVLLTGVLFLTLVNQPLRDLYDHRFVNQRAFHVQAQALLPRLPLAGKHLATQHGSWHEGLFLSFFTRSRYYGAVPAGISEEALYQTLKQHRIDYYLVWGKARHSLRQLEKILYLPEYQLGVYKVNLDLD